MFPALGCVLHPRRRGRLFLCGFTLVELLVVLAILSLLGALALPALRHAVAAGRTTACAHNVRQMQFAFMLYLHDHSDCWFPWREDVPEGTLWYWGLETGGALGGAEGGRRLDKTRARLWPYLQQIGGVEICPSLPYQAPYFKRKFEIASYGYALNAYMIAGLPHPERTGVRHMRNVRRPSETIVWADSVQINTWQTPASPKNPMLEEWYYLDGVAPPKFHFRHEQRLNAAFADGSVRAMSPHTLDPRCDGRVGFIEPPGHESWLRTNP
jgi:prepilin-type N-terminal cleavage/methylation domain-containing protein/prepilin-type processing-associated H-X9-DG protein